MDNKRYYITINRKRDFERALLHKLVLKNNLVVYKKEATDNLNLFCECNYISLSIDSGNERFLWDRILLDINLPKNASFTLSAYASDKKDMLINDEKLIDLDCYLSDEKINVNEKIRFTTLVFKNIFSNSKDGYINLSGRYIWLRISFLMTNTDALEIRKIKLLVAKERITDYLPEIYRKNGLENDFFKRYMAIFDNIFFDIENKIDMVGKTMDFEHAKGDLLKYLAMFVGITDVNDLDDEGLRAQIRYAAKGFSYIGTKKGIEETVFRLLGETPNIIEHFEINEMLTNSKDKDLYKKLFGSNPHKFFIMVSENSIIKLGLGLGKDYGAMLRKIEKIIPAGTSFDMIILRNRAVLNHHTYLGVNSCVTDYKSATLDTEGSVSYDTFIGG